MRTTGQSVDDGLLTAIEGAWEALENDDPLRAAYFVDRALVPAKTIIAERDAAIARAERAEAALSRRTKERDRARDELMCMQCSQCIHRAERTKAPGCSRCAIAEAVADEPEEAAP